MVLPFFSNSGNFSLSVTLGSVTRTERHAYRWNGSGESKTSRKLFAEAQTAALRLKKLSKSFKTRRFRV
jgi:hypothetical protein